MSWLQNYEIGVPWYEIRHGKYYFALQAHRREEGPEDCASTDGSFSSYRTTAANQVDRDENAFVTAVRSYSEFRQLWKDLLSLTRPPSQKLLSSSSSRFLPSSSMGPTSNRLRDNISSSVSAERYLPPTDANQKAPFSLFSRRSKNQSRRNHLVSSSSYDLDHSIEYSGPCPCSESYCPFSRLYSMLRNYPFPSRVMLKRSQYYMLEARRHGLDRFIVCVREYFNSFPKSFLQSVDQNERCRVLELFAKFIGFTTDMRAYSTAEPPLRFDAWRKQSNMSALSSSRRRHQEMHDTTLNRTVRKGSSMSDTNMSADGASSSGSTIEYASSVPDSHDNQLQASAAGESTQEDEIDARQKRAHTIYVSEPMRRKSSTSGRDARAAIQVIRQTKIKVINQFLHDYKQQMEREEARHKDKADAPKQWELALYIASQVGHVYAVEALLFQNVSPNVAMMDGSTPLHAASGGGAIGIIMLLVEYGSKVDAQDERGRTPLMCAIANNHTRATRQLLDAGADVNLRSVRSISAAHVAVAVQSLPLLRLLLDHDAFVNTANAITQKTPLHLAAALGGIEVVQFLLENGASAQQLDSSGFDAAKTAEVHGHEGVAELCRKYSDKPRSISSEHKAPLSAMRISALQSTIAMATTANKGDEEDVSFVATDGHQYAVM